MYTLNFIMSIIIFLFLSLVSIILGFYSFFSFHNSVFLFLLFSGVVPTANVFSKFISIKGIYFFDFYLKDEGSLAGIITTGPPPQSYVKSYPELVTNAADLTLKAIDKLLKENNLSAEEVDWMIPHPGTDVVLQDVLKRSPFAKEKVLYNFPEVGNTSAASIPIVLSENYYQGKVKKGDLILAPAVGGGFYWGGVLFKL